MWKLNNTLLNNHWVREGIKRKNRKLLETNKNKSITYKNIWDTVKREPGEKFK